MHVTTAGLLVRRLFSLRSCRDWSDHLTLARRSSTMSSPSSAKRKGNDGDISPPPVKRKLQSHTSKDAVSNFFKPTSQKPKDRTTWTERAPSDSVPATLLIGRYEAEQRTADQPTVKRRKIAAFDLDSTLISTSTGKKHAGDATDWKWWHTTVPGRLRDLHAKEGYRIVVFTNQAGLTLHPDPTSKGPKKGLASRVEQFKQKCSTVLAHLDVPLTLYAATAHDVFRKPRAGMWEALCADDGLVAADAPDLEQSFLVGDAGGRVALLGKGGTALAAPKDFSCSDRNFAHNVGIRYSTPEEFFLGEAPREFKREFDLARHGFVKSVTAATESDGTAEFKDRPLMTKKNDTDVVLFCGPPGAGKSTFYWRELKPLGYERVNQDILKSKEKCLKAAAQLLVEGKSVAIDATNPDPETRRQWIDLANKHKASIRCVWFKTPLSVAEHNDVVRALNRSMNPEGRDSLPKLAFTGFASRFKEPKKSEGFQDIIEVDFAFRGTEDEYKIWGRYWL